MIRQQDTDRSAALIERMRHFIERVVQKPAGAGGGSHL